MCSQQQLNISQAHTKAVAGFDVGVDVDVDVPSHQVTTHHTNRGFGGRGTVPDDMEHDGTALWARDYETAALYYYYKNNIYIKFDIFLQKT